MTVGDLIKILADHPKDMRVFVKGYEGGLEDPVMNEGWVELNANDSSVEGPHERIDLQNAKPGSTIVYGLIINRPGR